MKLNWGSGIAIFYTLFVIVMITMVVKSTQNKVHLVQENYYEKDLNYEEFRKKRENGQTVKDQIIIKYHKKDKILNISLPKTMNIATGELALFRPSNKFLDKKFKLKLDDNASMDIQLERSLTTGLWQVQLDWESGGKSYYVEESLVL
ncbi:MAG: FixH family protein [Bacteroidia bacterium]|nr:FixH family protein [Bacteroidia bacterium]